MKASLTYYIWEGLLVGMLNDDFIQMPAVCGGGGGSTKNPSANSVNNPYSTGLKTTGSGAGHVHGGPLPTGKYAVATPSIHPKLKLSARLTPTGGQPMFTRSGFLIHGAGPHGSDGCIVLKDGNQLKTLMNALTASGGGTLFVEETMSGGRFV